MRMDESQDISAEQIINKYSEKDLFVLLKELIKRFCRLWNFASPEAGSWFSPVSRVVQKSANSASSRSSSGRFRGHNECRKSAPALCRWFSPANFRSSVRSLKNGRSGKDCQLDIEKFLHLLMPVYYGADQRNSCDRCFECFMDQGHMSAHRADDALCPDRVKCSSAARKLGTNPGFVFCVERVVSSV